MRLIVLLTCFIVLVGCGKEEQKPVPQSDAVTAASVQKNPWMAPEGETYEVLGYKKGIKGCLIKYSDSLYRGGNLLSAEGGKYLQSLGIETVISVTPDEHITTICEAVGIDNISLYYDYGKLDTTHVTSFLTLLDSASYPIYIHCFSGKQRAGLLCAIDRLYNSGWSFTNAEDEYAVLGGKRDEDHPLLLMAEKVMVNFANRESDHK